MNAKVLSAIPPTAATVIPRTQIISNLAAYQAGWFACILGAAHGWPWLGTLTAAGLIIWHLRTVNRPYREAMLIAVSGVIGLIWDSLLVWIGWVAYTSGNFAPALAPHWIVALWMLFATTLNVSLNFLKGRIELTAICGFVGGPLAYFAGHALGALDFLDATKGLAAIGLGWAALFPILVSLSNRLNGVDSGNQV